jgi:integrase
VKIHLIQSNPSSGVKKAKPAPREIVFMTAAQARRFLTAAKSNQNYALFALALGSGARQGELLALTWSDLDLERGTMEIRRSLAQVKSEFRVKEPKSKSGRRTLTLPPGAVEAVREHRVQAFKAGRIADPVFCTRTGGFLERGNVLRAFRGIVKRTNETERKRANDTDAEPDLILERIRFHDLRHSHASHLIADGCSIKAVSRRLGHADVKITLSVYSHLMPDDDEKLARQAESLFA